MAYAPAGNTTQSVGLGQLASVYYNRKSLDKLYKKFVFREATEPDVMPLRSGKTMQWYRYVLFGGNTSPASEGVVGTSLVLNATTVSATVSEYSDYLTISTLLEETAIDPITANAAENLGYRAGLTVDIITRTEFDANIASVTQATLGANLAANDLKRACMLLEGVDVQPKRDDKFICILHPYVKYDLLADVVDGGFIDVVRYSDPNAILMNEIGTLGGCRCIQSTNVGTDGVAAPTTKYYTYVVGQGAVGAVDLAGRGPTNVMDPTKSKFKINTVQGGPQIADPAGMIGSAVSYRFVYAVKTLDATTFRYKIIPADSSII